MSSSVDFARSMLRITKLLSKAYKKAEFINELEIISLALSIQTTLRLPLMILAYDMQYDLAEEVCYWWLEGNMATYDYKTLVAGEESNPMDYE